MKFLFIKSRLIIPVVLLLIQVNTRAQDADWIRQSIDLTINTHFSEAESLLVKRMAAGDSGIDVNFYYASVLNSKMTHFENQKGEKKFIDALNKVIRKTDNYLESNPDIDSTAFAKIAFYAGSAYGYLAYYDGQCGKWYPALSNGMKAKKYLERAVELDSTLYDAYLGLGTYNYWVSSRVRHVLWLPFIPDNREQGIEYIKKTVRNKSYSKYMAMHQLIYVLLDYKDYKEAEILAEKVVKAYPESQFMWWANAHTYFKSKKYRQAVTSYLKILSLMEKNPESNPMHYLDCQVRLAEIYHRLGDEGACFRHSKLALERSYGDNLSKKDKKRLEQARELMENSRKKAEN
ncbi:MAG: tetratricopeptide repeat protein [Calditrichaceae bacterium]